MTKKSKSWASKAARDLVGDLREEAKNIYTHAGAFLMREVCDGIADLLEAAAKKVRELESEVARYQSELLRAGAEQEGMAHDVTQLEATIERLETRIAELEAGAPNSVTGGQDFA